MDSFMDIKPRYYFDEITSAFCIENYQIAKPFSSFLPGIAGVLGIPMWCFYVNRGQCVISFGIRNKDGAILEFLPADRAYRLASTHGFRTFLKFNNTFYQPFRTQNLLNGAKSKMLIYPSYLQIEEYNSHYGICTQVRYYTVPDKGYAAVAREIVITNQSNNQIEIEILDGLPLIVPYGKNDFALKNMSRTIEAWNYVENLEEKAPYFRLRSSAEDTTEVKEIKEGNFFVCFKKEGDILQRQKIVIDPMLVFGISSEIDIPYEFINSNKIDFQNQLYTNRTSCAFGYAKDTLMAGQSINLYTLVGHAKSKDKLNQSLGEIKTADFFTKSFNRNNDIMEEITNTYFIYSSDNKLNQYAKMCYLDNILRGGWPFTIKHNGKKDIIYLFSRKHGDLERDYNAFEIQDTYYSQGNGNFRDVNQNRRNDLYFNPFVFDFNVWYFMNLIQLDGYNPLVIKGISYKLNNFSDIEVYINDGKEKLLKFFVKPYLPFELLNFIEDNNIALTISSEEFLNVCILNSEKIVQAEPGEGFWIDHFSYNFDLIDNFESIYPDKMKELLLQRKYFYYDNEHYVMPRKERIRIVNGTPKQVGGYALDKKKLELINSRTELKHYMRTNYGYGEIYYTCLFEKLLCLLLNKISTLDMFGVGVEMEASKPGWNDALNGLPGIFASSSCETMELLRLVRMLKRFVLNYLSDVKQIEIFEELAEYAAKIKAILDKNIKNMDDATNFIYWDESNTIKEEFREKTRFGISGRTVGIALDCIGEFLDLCQKKLENAAKKAFIPEKGLYCAYFINEPIEYQVISTNEGEEVVKLNKFTQKQIALFLEAQVRAFKVIEDEEKKRLLYKNIKSSNLYDKQLRMYKTNETLENQSNQLGRIMAFTAGWLENESVFMHMEFKYLFEVLKAGMYQEFFEELKSVIPPYMQPDVYGRSIFENSSFIASSSNPDKSVHGTGFVARLSGTTTEFLNMLTIMCFGQKPFEMINKEVVLKLQPKLPSWMFTQESKQIEVTLSGGKQKILIEKDCFVAMLFGNTLVVYKNPERVDTFNINVKKYTLYFEEKVIEIEGDAIFEPYSKLIREGLCKKIIAEF